MDELPIDVSGARIMVVDDVPTNLDVLRQALEAASYQVMVATSGDTALSLAQRFAPDLILLDVNMPHMDGFDVCRLLKQADATRAIPVVFLTARDDTGDVVKGFDVGGVDYVLKPFRREEVLVRIRTHLEKARLERALREKNAALEAEVARRQIVTRQRDQLAEREAQRWGLC